jgi:cytochrome d ubiquinol oxidase subunit II
LTGIALMFGYAMLGSGWLILKTNGEVQAAAGRHGRICLLSVLLAIAVVSLWTPIMNQAIAARWFTWPNSLFLAPVPLATALLGWFTSRALDSTAEALHSSEQWRCSCFVSWYSNQPIPDIVPYHLTLWEAASSPRTQAFLLVGTLFLLPVILTYSAWSYWVFRGKARADTSYRCSRSTIMNDSIAMIPVCIQYSRPSRVGEYSWRSQLSPVGSQGT